MIHMYKEDLALNYLDQLICHKTQPNQTSHKKATVQPLAPHLINYPSNTNNKQQWMFDKIKPTIHRYFNNIFHESKALKKIIITETQNVYFHNKSPNSDYLRFQKKFFIYIQIQIHKYAYMCVFVCRYVYIYMHIYVCTCVVSVVSGSVIY